MNLPFNAIIGRPALYSFMAIAHYGYLVLKMPSPAGVLTVRGDRTAAVAAVERLHALAAEAARTEEDPSTSQSRAPVKAPKVQPSDPDDVPVKTVQIGADSSRTTRIVGNLEENRKTRSSLSSGQMWMCSPGNRHRFLGSPGK